MANTFKNARLVVTASMSTIYTCPGSTTALVLLAQATNIHASTDATVSLQWLDSSASSAVTRLAKNVALPLGAALGLLDGKLVLEAGDVLQSSANAVSSVELTVSVLELT